VSSAFRNVNVDFAPVPPRTGYVVAIVVGMWGAAAIGEIATFRWRRPLLAAMPSIALFVLILITGTGRAAALLVALFLGALLTYWGLEAAHSVRTWGRWAPTWQGGREEQPASVTGRVARRMGVFTVAVALIAPVVLPHADALLSFRKGGGGNGSGSGTGGGRVDLLADVAATLDKQSNLELFHVRASRPAYWKLATLTDFDGRIWSRGTVDESPATAGVVAPALVESPDSTSLTQRFTMDGLSGDYLPAAYLPGTVQFPNDSPAAPNLVYGNETADLRLASGEVSRLTYTVTSSVPTFDFHELQNAKIGTLSTAEFTNTPSLSPAVKDLLGNWTVNAETPFEKLSSIQNHLRTEFRYVLDPDLGSSTNALTDFLTKTRAGFCQQFAAAFAYLARALGYPARVDIGFLPGTETAPHTFSVKGTDAHAWPEVYFEKYGWVAFEPTPRAAAPPLPYTTEPGAQPPAAAGAGDPGARAGRGRGGSAGRLHCKQQGDLGAASRLCGERRNERVNKHLTPLEPSKPASVPAWKRAFARLVRLLALTCLIVLFAIPLLKQARRVHNLRRAHTARSAIAASFAEVEEAGADLYVARGRAEPATTYAERLSRDGHARRDEVMELADLYQQALFRAVDPDIADVTRARSLARAITSSLWGYATWRARARRLFSPRVLLQRWARGPIFPRPATA
ncbi:MAG: DUF3488 and transglutaminase-like domain-containing protein, partial [Actinomycetota bacterium]|nr:DUF3488 and transglutaminase-like domain-containing protein [Actinomycetota bacterium]